MSNLQSEKRRLFLDMDGTLAKFHDQANYLERMFEEGFFRGLEPFENMVEGVRQFIQDHPDVEVFILSAKVLGEPPYCEAEKNAWLDQYLPEIDLAHRIYTDTGKSKAEYVPGGVGKNDFLVDDYNKGLNFWLFDGGSAIKCHNNINQHGLGAYGGSAGRLWTGDMVHTDDTPAMISAELAQHMGLELDINRVLTAYKDISYMPDTQEKQSPEAPFLPLAAKHLIRKNSQSEPYQATYFNQESSRLVSETFVNPLNAIRWLDGKQSFREMQLQDLDGKKFSIPQFLANDIAANNYGYDVYKLYAWNQLPPDIASVFKEELENSKLPIVGQVNFLGSNGKVGESVIFHCVEDMKAEIADSFDCGRPITTEWFVHPKPLVKEITLETYPDMDAPESFKLSSDSLSMAAKVCEIPFDDVESFLFDYTWDDSLRIWEKYAQHIEKIADVMDGFASRREVEEEFLDAMRADGATPESAAAAILTRIEEWARWDNQDAFYAGVPEKAKALRESLEPSSDSPAISSKPALDAIISAARGQQGNKGKSSDFHDNER